MLNFFVEMENTMQIPIILIGTPKAVDVRTSEFRSAHLAHPSGRVYITQLTKQFTKRHEDGNLEKLGCPLSAQQNSSWLADMLRGRPRCAYPVQHLPLMTLLRSHSPNLLRDPGSGAEKTILGGAVT
jgi:hypothetical protein